jgi:hypothetical protein
VNWLVPLADAVRDRVMSATKLHADDAPVPSRDLQDKNGTVIDLCAGLPAIGRYDTANCAVRLLTGSQERASQTTPKNYTGAFQADTYARISSFLTKIGNIYPPTHP